MKVTRTVNRFAMLVAIVGTLAMGGLSIPLFGIGTSPSHPAAVASDQPAVALFLNVPKIKGESVRHGHEDEIEVHSVS